MKYRLKKGAARFAELREWNECTESEKEQIERISPNRFEFEETVKGVIPPAAIVEDKPKRSKPKKDKTEDK